MTFKHVKFEDSVTMRSLEKVAKEKGLVKPESIKKSASIKKADYSVTTNLTENVIKLCDGLRESGFSKYADELEEKFIAYKKANSLYETSKEKGEDLVDAAHPQGSHKLDGVEGDSVIETILDQQLKDVEMVNKHPSGKLSSAQIINQVKLVLGQVAEGDPNQEIKAKAQQFLGVLKRMLNVAGRELDDFDPDIFYMSMEQQFLAKPTLDNLNEAKSRLNGLKDSFSPGFFGGISKDTWSKIEGSFDVLEKLLDDMIALRKKANISAYTEIVTEKKPEAQSPAVAPEVQSLTDSFNDIDKKIARYKAIIEAKAPANLSALNQYLDKVSQSIKIRRDSFNKVPADNKVEVAKIYLDKLNGEVVPGLNAFEGAYVKS